MPSIVFFVNHKKPINGGGIPLFPHDRGIAFCNADYFFASPISTRETPYAPYSEWHQGATFAELKAWVQSTFGDQNPIESRYELGTVYKRIYWPPIVGSFHRAVDRGKATQSFVALRILLDKLAKIFQTIEPVKANQTTYGHLVRELLLLACMEVESSWAAVLKENNYQSKRKLTTSDYVKLNEVMLLDSYRLSLRSYPDFPQFCPFEGWDKSVSTKSLTWYDAYNKTKHDRESNLGYASLENAVQAVGAAVVMFYAQFGIEVVPSRDEQPVLVIRNTFSLHTDFRKHPQAFYVPNLTMPPDWPPVPTPSFDWKLVEYPF